MLLRKFCGIEKTDNGYLIHGDAGDIKLVFMTDDIIRIRVSFDRKFKEASYALVTTAWEDELDELFQEERTRIQAKDVVCEEKEDALIFHTTALKLVMKKQPIQFLLYDAEGKLIYNDLKERAFDQDQLGRVTHYSEIHADTDHFYGFGEKTGHLDKKGRHLRMSPKDAIGADPEFGEPLYKHVPFYIRVNEENLHALGLFYNNSYDAVFDMGNERSGYWDSYCYYQADGGDIDLFLINGPKMASVLERYTYLTGRQAMPTKQSLGYTASTMYYAELEQNCDEEIYKVIQKHFDEKIYIDNFWLASGYSSGEEDNLRYVFNWNKKRFPDPEGFFEKMEQEMGINVIPNMKPGILKNHPYRKVFEQYDAFVKTPDKAEDYVGRWWGGEGRFVDFTKKAGRDAWKELLKKNLMAKGMRTVWNDNCEYDSMVDKDCRCSFEGKGGTIGQLKSVMSNIMCQITNEAVHETFDNTRPYVVCRSGHAGIQRYAQTWAGDNLTCWDSLKYNIATILGMGLSGVANQGCDIGGFYGVSPEAELLVRWIQNGIFQPRFSIHSTNTDNTVTEPWMYSGCTGYIRSAILLRYRLFPYLYSLMERAHTTGLPIMEPMCYAFQNDPACYEDGINFMFGDSLLVANVVEKGAKIRSVYLPEGSAFYDFYTREVYEGGQTIEFPVNLGSIPLFVRSGALIPMASNQMMNLMNETVTGLTILCAPDKEGSFILYEDDGVSMDYEKGLYLKTVNHHDCRRTYCHWL